MDLTSFKVYSFPFHSPLSVRISQQPNLPLAFPFVPQTIAIESLPSTFAEDLSEVATATE